MKKLSLLLGLCLLVACATGPTTEQFSSAYFGAYPENYIDVVKTHISQIATDPASVYDIEISIPQKGWIKYGNTWVFGWELAYAFNTKNRMGGYVGKYSRDTFRMMLIRDGSIMADERLSYFVEKYRGSDQNLPIRLNKVN